MFQSNNEKDCFDKEIELIKLYGRKNDKSGILTNLTSGGEGMAGSGNPMFGKRHSNKTKLKISKVRQQKLLNGTLIPTKHSEEHKQRLRIDNPGRKATSKPIYQISTNGNIVKEWPSTRQAGLGIGIKSWRNISLCANKLKNRTIGGFYWRWVNDPDIENGILKNVEKLNFNRTDKEVRFGTRIQQFSLSGEFIKSWLSMQTAANHYNVSISSISLAIKQNRPTAGFVWKIIS